MLVTLMQLTSILRVPYVREAASAHHSVVWAVLHAGHYAHGAWAMGTTRCESGDGFLLINAIVASTRLFQRGPDMTAEAEAEAAAPVGCDGQSSTIE